ncbi:MAG: hypothetical protein JWO38_5739 [Gemmataceae bacterium]|nr:hypothetical protein [Gemmataceae bacterium]
MLRRNRAARQLGWVGVVALGVAFAAPAADDEIARPLAALKAVDREGKNNDTAGLAWKAVVSKGGPALFPTLEAIDDANPTAANWLRTAAGAIAEGETKAGRPLPADKLEGFIKDTKNAPSARRIAYELLIAQDKTAADRILPGLLNDPGADLRRDAIAAELDKLEKAARPTVKTDLEKLFAFARDPDQVDAIAKKLAGYGVAVNVSEHFAFVTHYRLAGPFESSQGKALTLSHAPETDPAAAGPFKGKGGIDVTWKPCVTADKTGAVDLNEVVGKIKDAAVYARAEVVAEKDTPCEIRVASPNAVRIFLNGKNLFEREEYHHGSSLDHHIGKGVLKAGTNVVVLKVGQNNQSDSWAQTWKFQLRICDATGGKLPGLTQIAYDPAGSKPVPLGTRPATPTKEDKK